MGPPPTGLSSGRRAARWITWTSYRAPLLQQTGAVDRIERLAVPRRMRLAGVKEVQIDTQVGLGVRDRIVSLQRDLLVLNVLPEPLDADVIAPAALALPAAPDFETR